MSEPTPDTGPRRISRRSLLAGTAASGVTGAAGFVVGRAEREEPHELRLRTGELTTTNALRDAVQPDGVLRVDTTSPVVGLSFDDGPDPKYTPMVLDVLEQKGARATFFVVGVNALAHRDLLARALAAGHSVGNHTFDHVSLETLDPAAVASEIDRGEQAIVDAGAPRPHLFRPPRGLTDEVVAVFADAERYRTIFWTLAVEHYVLHAPVAVAVERILARVRPGDIVLAHDGGHIAVPGAPTLDRSSTVAALPLLLDGLSARRLEVVDIPTLLRHQRRREFRLPKKT
jgi:peptidoglycan/xylan/chitin deacetylase (PgdA/CDA1 family)